MPSSGFERRTFLVAGSVTITSVAGCIGALGVQEASTYETYLSVRNSDDVDVDILVSVYNATLEEELITETVTVPADERHEFEFTVAYDEPGGSATVSVSLENVETGAEASADPVFGAGSGSLGFSGRIDEDGTLSLTTDVE
ncbi:hypothetical protein [Halovivax cerinus]|uniref:Uncharacterized protein n=1 Tax=Halovivax cerinus TaxID=1487865 RepID=A0ABD5NLW9_9EURY|nr:hypothetical protein [Halovivax cerinus]